MPGGDVDTLLVPVSGPWVSLPAAIAFVRRIAPARAFPIHDAHLGEIGLETADWWLAEKGGADYRRLPAGEPVTLRPSAQEGAVLGAEAAHRRPGRPA